MTGLFTNYGHMRRISHQMATSTPKNCVQRTIPLHDAKVMAWCGIASTIVLDPYFFEKVTPQGFQSCCVTAMLQNCVIPELRQRNALHNIVWMQDCALSHMEMSARRILQQHFGDRVISHHFPFPVEHRDTPTSSLWISGIRDNSNIGSAIPKLCQI
ncbi:uncharacterized protein TNIN_182441 [Trichonephila inaurata madagascariensis]|uniref:Transposase n=1 Tax=Trichonephila inaurata madagascariensis TaxID=2747483 RepID=A0A8X6XN81_9ARAC|nr:uncharacterized protein TNIN_182441 [Trichonephila inaurata madagascariensis]